MQTQKHSKLNFIYGRAGSGKTCYCCEQISSLIRSNNKVLLIVPEQASFMSEKHLLNFLGHELANKLEILSFSRLASNIISKFGPINSEYITETSKIAILQKAVLESYDLTLINSNNLSIDQLFRTITEFKNCNIEPNEVTDVINKISDFKDVQNLMSDLSKIYRNYEQILFDHDSSNNMKIVAEKISENMLFKDYFIFLDGFHDFNGLEFIVIKNLLINCIELNVTLLLDSNELNDFPEVFFKQKKTAAKLINIAKQIKNNNINTINLNKIHKFKTEELKYLEKNFLNYSYEKFNKKNNNIKIISGSDKFQEIELVANNIINLCQEYNYRYNEILILIPEISYINIIQEIFLKFNISYFYNSKKSILNFTLVQKVLSILQIILNNFQTEDLIKYAKLGFTDISVMELAYFENYCIACGINQRNWLSNSDWTYVPPQLFRVGQVINIESINKTRHKLADNIMEFTKNLDIKNSDSQVNIYEFTHHLFELLTKLNIDKITSKKISNLIKQNLILEGRLENQIWDLLVESLQILLDTYKKEMISFKEYYILLKTIFNNQYTAESPNTLDQVTIGLIGNHKNSNTKCTIIVGVNDGVFPSTNIETGYLSSNNRDLLISAGLNLPLYSHEIKIWNQFLVYEALTFSSEKLILCYSRAGTDSSELKESVIIHTILKMFPDISIDTSTNDYFYDSYLILKRLIYKIVKLTINEGIYSLDLSLDPLWLEIQKWLVQNNTWNNLLQKGLFYLNSNDLSEKLKIDQAKSLYISNKGLSISISRAEQFANCQFAHYLKYGLKIEPRLSYEPNSTNIGIILHEIINNVFCNNQHIISEDINSNKSNRYNFKSIKQITVEVLKKQLSPEVLYSERYSRFADKIARIIEITAQNILDYYISTGARSIGYEVSFNDDLPNSLIKLTGKVDRVDITSGKSCDYLTIIDYKSGSQIFDYTDLYYGSALQLPFYMGIMQQIYSKNNTKSVIPIGMLYKKFQNPQIDMAIPNCMTEQEKQEILKVKMRNQTKMNGLTLGNPNGDFVKSNVSNCLELNEMQQLIEYSKYKILEISDEILNGNNTINPLFIRRTKLNALKVCDYCNYYSVCRVNKNKIRPKEKIYKEEFFEYVAKHINQVDKKSDSSDSAS